MSMSVVNPSARLPGSMSMSLGKPPRTDDRAAHTFALGHTLGPDPVAIGGQRARDKGREALSVGGGRATGKLGGRESGGMPGPRAEALINLVQDGTSWGLFVLGRSPAGVRRRTRHAPGRGAHHTQTRSAARSGLRTGRAHAGGTDGAHMRSIVDGIRITDRPRTR